MKKPMRMSSKFVDDLAILHTYDRDTLLRRWSDLCTITPPPRMSTKLLLQVVAYKLQERGHGGLALSVRRFMEKAANDAAFEKPIARITNAKPGTRLIREWRGIVYEVVIKQDGVLLNGERVRSLSAAAHKITGAKWSGPRFFGLVKGG